MLGFLWFFCIYWVWKYEKSLWEQVCTKHGKKQTTKTWEEPDNHKEQCFWTKPLAHTFLTNPFFWVFFFKVFGFLVVLVAGKSFRTKNQKNSRKTKKTKKTKKTNVSEESPWPRHSSECFGFFGFFGFFRGFWVFGSLSSR